MPIDFNILIDNYLSKKFKPKPIGRYYPSGIGDCLRKQWFSYKFPQEHDKELIKIFATGNMFHDFITDVLKSEKNNHIKLIDSELPLIIKRNNFIISGRIDNLVLLKVDNKKILVEVKSCKSLPQDPKPENIMQLQFYMYATRVWDGALVYVQKDNLQTKTFHIRCKKETAYRIMQRFEDLHNFLTKNQIPKPEAKLKPKMKFMCTYCPYKEKCNKT